MQLKKHKYKSWVEVSRGAIIANYLQFQKIVGKNTLVVPVVKANAYGHGMKEVVTILKDKTNFFCG
ncbi:alanine racemase [Patescibacteria group bacterium]